MLTYRDGLGQTSVIIFIKPPGQQIERSSHEVCGSLRGVDTTLGLDVAFLSLAEEGRKGWERATCAALLPLEEVREAAGCRSSHGLACTWTCCSQAGDSPSWG